MNHHTHLYNTITQMILKYNDNTHNHTWFQQQHQNIHNIASNILSHYESTHDIPSIYKLCEAEIAAWTLEHIPIEKWNYTNTNTNTHSPTHYLTLTYLSPLFILLITLTLLYYKQFNIFDN